MVQKSKCLIIVLGISCMILHASAPTAVVKASEKEVLTSAVVLRSSKRTSPARICRIELTSTSIPSVIAILYHIGVCLPNRRFYEDSISFSFVSAFLSVSLCLSPGSEPLGCFEDAATFLACGPFLRWTAAHSALSFLLFHTFHSSTIRGLVQVFLEG